MSQRTTTFFTCDLCRKDIPDLRKAVHVLVRGTAGCGLDIGPCCAGKTIADMSAAANKLIAPERIPV